MKRRWPEFLATFEGVPQSLEELVEFNKAHADIELQSVCSLLILCLEGS